MHANDLFVEITDQLVADIEAGALKSPVPGLKISVVDNVVPSPFTPPATRTVPSPKSAAESPFRCEAIEPLVELNVPPVGS